MLGKLSVRNFKPKTVKKGKETSRRKKELKEEFIKQNPRLAELQTDCIGKQLSINVIFYLNKNTSDKSSYKKDLDNLLKILMDVIKEEMDDNEKKIGLGLVVKNKDEEIFEINCRKKFVLREEDEGIDLEISEWLGNKDETQIQT